MGTSADVESAVVKQVTRFGGKIPEPIANKPVLHESLLVFMIAFNDLDTERAADLQPIPWSKVQEYADRYQFNAELRWDLLYVIRNMDNAYRKQVGKQRG